jgi:hypothetical protein
MDIHFTWHVILCSSTNVLLVDRVCNKTTILRQFPDWGHPQTYIYCTHSSYCVTLTTEIALKLLPI